MGLRPQDPALARCVRRSLAGQGWRAVSPGRGSLGAREGLDVRPVEPEVWPVRDEGAREGGMGRARHGVVTAGDFRKKKAGRPCRIVSDSDGLPMSGHGARSPRAARRNAGYATSIIPDSAALHPGFYEPSWSQAPG